MLGMTDLVSSSGDQSIWGDDSEEQINKSFIRAADRFQSPEKVWRADFAIRTIVLQWCPLLKSLDPEEAIYRWLENHMGGSNPKVVYILGHIHNRDLLLRSLVLLSQDDANLDRIKENKAKLSKSAEIDDEIIPLLSLMRDQTMAHAVGIYYSVENPDPRDLGVYAGNIELDPRTLVTGQEDVVSSIDYSAIKDMNLHFDDPSGEEPDSQMKRVRRSNIRPQPVFEMLREQAEKEKAAAPVTIDPTCFVASSGSARIDMTFSFVLSENDSDEDRETKIMLWNMHVELNRQGRHFELNTYKQLARVFKNPANWLDDDIEDSYPTDIGKADEKSPVYVDMGHNPLLEESDGEEGESGEEGVETLAEQSNDHDVAMTEADEEEVVSTESDL